MSEQVLDYDIVIIGSGAGGGTMAQELGPLAQAGCRIALLEWGGRFQAADNNRNELEMAEKYYFGNGAFQTRSMDLTLAFARAVGGSTTVYTGTSIKAPRSVLEAWAVPGVTAEDLAPRFAKFIEQNHVHLNPREDLNENNLAFEAACRRLGWRVEQFPVNTRGCEGLATCNLGCARLAKQGTAVVQIPAAERMGVETITFCRADRIEGHDVVAQVSPPLHGLAPSSLAPGAYRFRAGRIVVAGGSINSPALLLRSFGDRLSPALGRYFTCHPAMILAGVHPGPIHGTSGHPKSFYCDEFAESQGFLLETCMYFPFTFAKSLTGFGPDLDDMLSRFDHLQMILSLAIDRAEPHNRITLDAQGGPVVDYRFSERVLSALVASVRASARILFEAGAEKVHAPGSGRFYLHRHEAGQVDRLVQRALFKLGQVTLSAAHLMGGCRMGVDPATSVTDPWGRVHGQDHLFVADASLFPDSVGINPYLTIMALADRVAQGIRKDMGSRL